MEMLAAPSITVATHVMLLVDGAMSRKKRSNTSATTIASASASTMINSAATTDTTDVLHRDPLLHARVKNRSATKASVHSLCKDIEALEGG